MKLLVVDDHPLVRKGIISTISFEEHISELLEASNVNEAMIILDKGDIDVALIDLYLKEENGLEIVFKSKERGLNTKFIVLTSSLKKEDYLRASGAGVEGYILKEAFAEDILYAVNVVLRGKKYVDPEVLEYQSQSNKEKDLLKDLTPREFDVLRGLGEGLSNYEIAKKLYISEYTVKKHVSNILSKLELTHRTQAALLINNVAKSL